ncbi:hypothetical protein NPIL_476381 [Nephila pilipes]|uniref:Uncharacterized protein n=1 Tax=Nephila pilipes TaxID=299642 RepID=A0A8X6PWZ0_NEPPI|nr:hypothetical protein NPIL_476381 [Nephila pilipes]
MQHRPAYGKRQLVNHDGVPRLLLSLMRIRSVTNTELLDLLRRHMYTRQVCHPEYELWIELATTWEAIPQDFICTLIDSMSQCLWLYHLSMWTHCILKPMVF